MVQQIKSAFRDLWARFVDSFVGAAATATLVGVGALVTGIYERIHQIDDIAARQARLEEKLDAREKDQHAAQEKSAQADHQLELRLEHFSGEHSMIMNRLDTISGRRAAGPIR